MDYLDVIKAGEFWNVDEDDIFTLSQIAFALGIGRNKMRKVPVARIMVERRAYYRKGDILDWALSKEGKETLTQLRNENTKIGRAITARTKAYDHIYTVDPKSHYRPSNGIKETKEDKFSRLWHEWEDIRSKLERCDGEELKDLMEIAWIMRKQFVKLRMGLPEGIGLSNWWFAENLTEAKRRRVRKQIKWCEQELRYIKVHGEVSPCTFVFCSQSEANSLDEEIESIKEELVQLNAELVEIG